jgi:hypothetical protein
VLLGSSRLLQLGNPELDLLSVQAIGEGEMVAALAPEEGAPREPHRQRIANHRALPALLADEHHPLRR